MFAPPTRHARDTYAPPVNRSGDASGGSVRFDRFDDGKERPATPTARGKQAKSYIARCGWLRWSEATFGRSPATTICGPLADGGFRSDCRIAVAQSRSPKGKSEIG